MKKKIAIFFVLLLIINSVNCFSLENENFTSKSVILTNAEDGKILFEKNSKEKLYPASITKVMLLILASEKLEEKEISLTDEVRISANSSGMGGSQIYLEENEIQTVDSLIKATCIRSANDAAVALAEFLYGSEEECVNKMNNKAVELGMMDTSFANVTGLHDENHYSSAYDIAIMSKELLKYTYLTKYLLTWMDSIYVGKDKDIEQVLVNTNKLVNNYDGLLGIKTGFTTKSLYCLTTAAERNGVKLIAVLLNCSNSKVRFQEARNLLNYGFANYKNLTFYNSGDVITKSAIEGAIEDSIDITAKKNVSVLINNDCKEDEFDLEYKIEKNLIAPLDVNTVVGKIYISRKGNVEKEINLYPSKNVEKAKFISILFKKIKQIIFKTTI